MTTGPDIITALNADADLDRCAVTSGTPQPPGHELRRRPGGRGWRPRTDQRFRVCSAHAHLVSDPRPIVS